VTRVLCLSQWPGEDLSRPPLASGFRPAVLQVAASATGGGTARLPAGGPERARPDREFSTGRAGLHQPGRQALTEVFQGQAHLPVRRLGCPAAKPLRDLVVVIGDVLQVLFAPGAAAGSVVTLSGGLTPATTRGRLAAALALAAPA